MFFWLVCVVVVSAFAVCGFGGLFAYWFDIALVYLFVVFWSFVLLVCLFVWLLVCSFVWLLILFGLLLVASFTDLRVSCII